MRVLKQERPDIFHINSSKMGGTGTFAVRLMNAYWSLSGGPHRTRAIFTAHGWPFWEPRHVITKSLIAFFSWLTALFAHKVITVSNYDLKVATQMPFVGHKAVRIYNGIDFNTQFGSGEEIRAAFPAHAIITGTVGELNKNKNQIALIEEARHNSEMCVAIVGEGELRHFLEQKIAEYGLAERVKLFGYRPRETVLKGFDLFALPSLKEGLPYVLIEAKLAGLPIKANRVGGVSEILDQDLSLFSLEHMYKETFAVYHK
jgi:glycosyltransferase involved in cell wall biosynthesis